MLGGTLVNITGPCFEPNDKVQCLFWNRAVEATVIDRNRAVCIQPRIEAEGFQVLSVKINNQLYDWKGNFFFGKFILQLHFLSYISYKNSIKNLILKLKSETPATATEKIFFINDDVDKHSPDKIDISWEAYNLTTIRTARVAISLWGYRETGIKNELEFIETLEVCFFISNFFYFHTHVGQIRIKKNKCVNFFTDRLR